MKRRSRIAEMQARNQTICEYCGKTKDGISFVIGASRTPDWVMIEGTGAMCCPDCWEMARIDGQNAVDRHCKSMGRRENDDQK